MLLDGCTVPAGHGVWAKLCRRFGLPAVGSKFSLQRRARCRACMYRCTTAQPVCQPNSTAPLSAPLFPPLCPPFRLLGRCSGRPSTPAAYTRCCRSQTARVSRWPGSCLPTQVRACGSQLFVADLHQVLKVPLQSKLRQHAQAMTVHTPLPAFPGCYPPCSRGRKPAARPDGIPAQRRRQPAARAAHSAGLQQLPGQRRPPGLPAAGECSAALHRPLQCTVACPLPTTPPVNACPLRSMPTLALWRALPHGRVSLQRLACILWRQSDDGTLALAVA